ncbi:MAG: hypothetical protein K6G75_09685 [Lachnospiraceae bacterium]|nr:hypothetical protein [Lachnospiraceae bacterium]
MEQINREFKAVVQDMTHVYIGAQMSVSELISYEDVPFKVKAVFNKYFGKAEDKERKIGDLVGSVKKDNFTYQVIKQLKIKFKVGTYTVKNGSETYRSKTLTFDEFLDLHSSDEKYFDEELVFNKLALLAFST